MNKESKYPLKEKIIVVTRSQGQQGEARELFTNEGAIVLDLPSLVIVPPTNLAPLDKAIRELDVFDWLIFSSSNGVTFLEERLHYFRKSLSQYAESIKIAAVGRKTAHTIEKIGVNLDFVPPDFIAESLIDNFPGSEHGRNLLLPRVESGGRNILAESFKEKGFDVTEVAAYNSCCPEQMPEETAKSFIDLNVDAILFTSSKTAKYTATLMKRRFGPSWLDFLKNVKVISIGPQTSISCQENFKRVDEEADPHDLEGLMKATIKSFAD